MRTLPTAPDVAVIGAAPSVVLRLWLLHAVVPRSGYWRLDLKLQNGWPASGFPRLERTSYSAWASDQSQRPQGIRLAVVLLSFPTTAPSLSFSSTPTVR